MSATIAMPLPTVQPLARRRWADDEFDRLMELGLIREGSPAFLWDGEIIEPMVEDNPHIHAVEHLREILTGRFPTDAWTLNQNGPIQLTAGYRPQPDLSLIRGPRSAYRARRVRPGPGDVALLVEVSDTTYSYDSGEFLRKYAEAGIPRYWIVNIGARRIEVYADPDPEARTYRDRNDYGLDSQVPLIVTVGGVASEFGAVAVRDVLQDSLDEA